MYNHNKNKKIKKTVCFFVNLKEKNPKKILKTVEFYKQDILFLKKLGYKVTLSDKPYKLSLYADLYFSWWWGHSALAVLIGFLLRKPVLTTGAFDYATCRKEIPGKAYIDRPWWQKALIKLSLRHSKANLFISKHELTQVTKKLKVTNPVLLYPSVNYKYYKPLKIKETKQSYFFAVCFISKENVLRKGLMKTIQAVKILKKRNKKILLIIAGNKGNYFNTLKSIIAKEKLEKNILFQGPISEKKKISLMQNCLAYVQPSLYEGFGLALAEAVSCGARVITSKRGSIPEVVGKHGIFVDPRSPNKIAKAMYHCLCKKQFYSRALEAHKFIKEKFSPKIKLKKLKNILKNASKK